MKLFSILIVAFVLTSDARAENWPGWRGPTLNGVAGGENYPTQWSRTENVAWKVELPGKGSSTPAVWGKRIFLTCPGDGKNLLLCYDRDGKELWRTAIGKDRGGKNRKASGSNPSPTTDGKHVYIYYKSGDLACVDFEGKIVWQKNLQDLYGKDTLWWDLGSSPVLTKDLVVVACMHSGPSYLAGLDKLTGRVVWKQDRNLGAPVESAQSYTTPVVLSQGDRELIVVLGADHVTTHDARDGRELWRVGGLNPTNNGFFRSISSPVVSDGLVFAPYSRGKILTAIRLGGQGDVTKSHVAWTKNGAAADVPSPVAVNGRVYILRDRGDVMCLEAKTGKTIWQGRAPRGSAAFSSSPILADGKIYVTREDGTTAVLKDGKEFKLLATNELGEQMVATPVFTDGRILMRTARNLYCIGKSAK